MTEKKISQFGHNVQKYRLLNIVTASFKITLEQTIEMSQQKTATYTSTHYTHSRTLPAHYPHTTHTLHLHLHFHTLPTFLHATLDVTCQVTTDDCYITIQITAALTEIQCRMHILRN